MSFSLLPLYLRLRDNPSWTDQKCPELSIHSPAFPLNSGPQDQSHPDWLYPDPSWLTITKVSVYDWDIMTWMQLKWILFLLWISRTTTLLWIRQAVEVPCSDHLPAVFCCVCVVLHSVVLSCGVCYEAQIVVSSGHLCNYRYSTELLLAKVVFNLCL